MVELRYQSGGERVAIGIIGEKEEITQQFWSFYNHGATDEKNPIYLSKQFAYFWTTPSRLLHALKKAELFKILNKKEAKGWRAKKLARERGEKRAIEIPAETFITDNVPNISPYRFVEQCLDNESEK